jgi:hypothetical protein
MRGPLREPAGIFLPPQPRLPAAPQLKFPVDQQQRCRAVVGEVREADEIGLDADLLAPPETHHQIAEGEFGQQGQRVVRGPAGEVRDVRVVAAAQVVLVLDHDAVHARRDGGGKQGG